MKHYLLTILFLGILTTAYTQQTLEGIVTDTQKKPLESVTITCKNENNKILGFARSNAKGVFTITSKEKHTNYILEFTAIGYKKGQLKISEPHKKITFQMEEDAILLKDVTVKSRPVLRNVGDTLNYNPADFADKQDRSIGDVLKKMPGITVNDAGKIDYNGKSISSFYIDGDNLLDDKYNLGTKAIPHDAVEKIQVIEKDQPIKMLRKNNTSEDVALNLVLKKEARIKWMGDIMAGIGTPSKYSTNINGMLFKKNIKILNNLEGNNTGHDPSSNLTSHNLSEILQKTENFNAGYFLNSIGSSVPNLPSKRTLRNQSGAAILNNLIKFNDNIQFKTNGAFYMARHHQDYSSLTAIYLPGDTIRYQEKQHTTTNPMKAFLKFDLIDNSENHYIKNTLSFEGEGNISESQILANTIPSEQFLSRKNYLFSNEFNFRKILNKSKSISFYSFLNHTKAPEKLELTPGLNEDVFNNGIPFDLLRQDVSLPTYFANNSVSLGFTKNRLIQTYRAAFIYQDQFLNTSIWKRESAKNLEPVSGNMYNDLKWNMSKLAATAIYEFKSTKLNSTLTLPFSTTHIGYQDQPKKMDKKENYFFADPSFNLRYQTGAEHYITGGYSHKNRIGNISDVYEGAILKNYRSLLANNAPLSHRSSNTYFTNFNYKKSLKMVFFNVGINYSDATANTISSYTIQDNIEKRNVIEMPNKSESFGISTGASKYIFAITSTISGGASISKSFYKQLQNDLFLPYETQSLSYKGKMSTKFSKYFNVDYEFKFSSNNSKSDGKSLNSGFYQTQQDLELFYSNLKGFHINLSGQYMNTHQPNQRNLKYIFSDATIRYTVKKWKTDLSLSVTNLGNIQNYEAIYTSANSFMSGMYKIPGRTAVVRALFNFR